MSDLERRRPSSPSRRSRADRAYKLSLTTGGLALAAIVLFVLAVVSSVSLGWAFLAALLAAGSGFMLRRTLKP